MMRIASAIWLPYVVWMALMAALPSTAWAYAVRSAATLGALALVAFAWRGGSSGAAGGAAEGGGSASENAPSLSMSASIALGIATGLGVWALWVLPENFELYRRIFIIGSAAPEGPSPYDPAVCGWILTLVRLFGSAFVISAAEELFFRKWLYGWLGGGEVRWLSRAPSRLDVQALLWMTALFAVEHNRWLVGAAAGVIYALLALRRGLASAIIAHATTNLVLGLQVIATNNWAFW